MCAAVGPAVDLVTFAAFLVVTSLPTSVAALAVPYGKVSSASSSASSDPPSPCPWGPSLAWTGPWGQSSPSKAWRSSGPPAPPEGGALAGPVPPPPPPPARRRVVGDSHCWQRGSVGAGRRRLVLAVTVVRSDVLHVAPRHVQHGSAGPGLHRLVRGIISMRDYRVPVWTRHNPRESVGVVRRRPVLRSGAVRGCGLPVWTRHIRIPCGPGGGRQSLEESMRERARLFRLRPAARQRPRRQGVRWHERGENALSVDNGKCSPRVFHLLSSHSGDCRFALSEIVQPLRIVSPAIFLDILRRVSCRLEHEGGGLSVRVARFHYCISLASLLLKGGRPPCLLNKII